MNCFDGFRFVVCRGDDGNDYDEFECAASSIPADNRPAGVEAPLQLQKDWRPVSPRGVVSNLALCMEVLGSRDLITLPECEELGRFYADEMEAAEEEETVEDSRMLSSSTEGDGGGTATTVEGVLIGWSSPTMQGTLGMCTVYNSSRDCDNHNDDERYVSSATYVNDVELYRLLSDHLKPVKSPWMISRKKKDESARSSPSRAIRSGEHERDVTYNWGMRSLLSFPLIGIMIIFSLGGIFLFKRWHRGPYRISRERQE